jgi:CheY-like chemotaxis protein
MLFRKPEADADAQDAAAGRDAADEPRWEPAAPALTDLFQDAAPPEEPPAFNPPAFGDEAGYTVRAVFSDDEPEDSPWATLGWDEHDDFTPGGAPAGDGIASPADMQEPPEDAREETPPADRRLSLLVVEDNEEARHLIVRVLGPFYTVDAVADARSALERMSRTAFDVLVMDIHLGGKQTGADILRIARTLPGYEHVTAIAVTAYALPGDREQFLKAGFDGYVSKPFTVQVLLDALAEAGAPAGARL